MCSGCGPDHAAGGIRRPAPVPGPSAPRGPTITDVRGLSEAEASALRERHGPNRVAGRRPPSVARRLLRQLRDPLILVLLAAAALTLATGDYADAAIIACVVVVNSAVGTAQEVRAAGAVAALSAMAAPTCRVRRDGVTRTVAADRLVPGDVLELGQGDIVPADADVLSAAALLVDESALTGESVPVDKVGPGAGRAGQQLSAGTVVLRGRAVARVSATGATSALGRIAALTDVEPGPPPLPRRLIGLGRVLAVAAVLLCALVGGLGLLRGQPLELMAVTAISLVVAAVPESLPAVVTLSLALGARRMAQRRAIVRRLPAVETLGSVTILATDKTGTLTEGLMVVERLWTPAGEAEVTGHDDDQRLTVDDGPVPAAAAPALGDLLAAGALCNDAVLEAPTAHPGGPDGPGGPGGSSGPGDRTAVGDPTETALLTAAVRFGPAPTVDLAGAVRVDEVPFDSGRRRMSTLHRLVDGRYLLVGKGAPESMPATAGSPGGAAAARAADLAGEGYRVLAVAWSVLEERPPDLVAAETGLRLLGLVAIADPPRLAAAGAVAACRAAGITPVLITGDHVATARRVAERLGLIDPGDRVAAGDQLDDASPLDPTGVRVFARTSPEQKLDVVQAWRDAGQVVAMIGDGVNDGPALRRADIGVAMGGRGTEVARQAADLVLADDDLATVVAAVEEGRRVYANVRRFLLYALAGGTAEILVMLLGPLFGLALPLVPAQILWINVITHGLPGVALGAEPADPASMTRPPRPPAETVLGAHLWQRILQLGVVITATSLGVALWAHAVGGPWQSMLFLALASTQLGVALGVRSRPRTWENPFLLLATASAFCLQVLALHVPALQQLLRTSALTLPQLAAVSAVSTVGFVAVRLQTVAYARAARSVSLDLVRGGHGMTGARSAPVPGPAAGVVEPAAGGTEPGRPPGEIRYLGHDALQQPAWARQSPRCHSRTSTPTATASSTSFLLPPAR